MLTNNNSKFIIKYDHFKDDLLLCIKCNEYKCQEDFYNRKDAITRNFKDYSCKKCAKLHRKIDYTKQRTNKLKYLNTLDGYIKTVLQHAKYRKKHEFNITFDDILEIYNKQNGLCVYTKETLTYVLGEGNVNTNMSLDRIDSNKGYTKDNIQLTLRIINTMKTNLKETDFLNFCKLVTINNKI